MSQGANIMGQGEGTLSQAAGMVVEAKADFDRLNKDLEGKIQEARTKWGGQGGDAFQALGVAWAEKQKVIVSALNQFEESLRGTEKDNTSTDETQSSNYNRNMNRLG